MGIDDSDRSEGLFSLGASSLGSFKSVSGGTLEDEYSIYLRCADDGNGGDIPTDGEPLLTFAEWLNS